MNKLNQDGAVSGLAVSLILTVILLLGAIGFGYWAFASRQDYKNNTDAKVDAAVKTAVEQESIRKDKQFAEDEKNPLRTYLGPGALGSLIVKYPKTWSGYADTNTSGGAALSAYFNPGVVPSVTDENSTFALRIYILNQSYDETVQNFRNEQQSAGDDAPPTTISAYTLPKLPKVVGVKVVGAISDKTTGTVIVLPLRSQTLEIQTDGTQYLHDFNKYILPNFSFSP